MWDFIVPQVNAAKVKFNSDTRCTHESHTYVSMHEHIKRVMKGGCVSVSEFPAFDFVLRAELIG